MNNFMKYYVSATAIYSRPRIISIYISSLDGLLINGICWRWYSQIKRSGHGYHNK